MSLEFDSLQDIAEAMTIKGKGILAADESNPTCKKRFDSIGVESTEQNRNLYRDMLFTTEGMKDFISGVILSILCLLARFAENKATSKTRFLEERPPLSHKTNNAV